MAIKLSAGRPFIHCFTQSVCECREKKKEGDGDDDDDDEEEERIDDHQYQYSYSLFIQYNAKESSTTFNKPPLNF